WDWRLRIPAGPSQARIPELNKSTSVENLNVGNSYGIVAPMGRITGHQPNWNFQCPVTAFIGSSVEVQSSRELARKVASESAQQPRRELEPRMCAANDHKYGQ